MSILDDGYHADDSINDSNKKLWQLLCLADKFSKGLYGWL